MQHHPDRARRALLAAAAAGVPLLGLAACGTTPPLRWHRLPLVAAGAAPADGATASERWEVVRDLALPEYLQRETMWFDAGGGRLQALAQDRWAEPLQDALPRLLLHDLATLRGSDRVWAAPAPLDVKAQQRLRVQIVALDAQPERARLVLQARCTWQALQPLQSGGGASRVHDHRLQEPLADRSAASLVQAHRAAMLALARQIAAGV
jgi:uncharacterized protein